jgi:hypothetical protein
MELFIEEKLLNSVKSLLLGRVNELLRETEGPIPPVELSNYRGGSAVVPVIALSACERSEKERIVIQDAYTLTIAVAVPESLSEQSSVTERNVYAYGWAVDLAVAGDRTLGGIVDRAVLTGKKYTAPKAQYCGENWEVVITLRLTIERLGVTIERE